MKELKKAAAAASHEGALRRVPNCLAAGARAAATATALPLQVQHAPSVPHPLPPPLQSPSTAAPLPASSQRWKPCRPGARRC